MVRPGGDYEPTFDDWVRYTFSLPNWGWPDIVTERETDRGDEVATYNAINIALAGGLALGPALSFETFGGYMMMRSWAMRIRVAKFLTNPVVLALTAAAVVGTSITENVNSDYTMFEKERQQRGQDQASAGSHYRW